jgi:hypothetical protein
MDVFLKMVGKAFESDGAFSINGRERKLETQTVHLHYVPNEKTAEAECLAINTMNNLPMGAMARELWKFTLDFQRRPTPINLLRVFPELLPVIEAHPQGDEQATAIRGLEYDLHGYAFISGGPGSGKSSLGSKIVKALVSTGRTVAWICPSNAIAKDAVNRFHREMPDKECNRMFPWDAEMDCMVSPPKVPNLIQVRGNASKWEIALAKHVNRIRTQAHEEKSAHANEYTVSNFAKHLAKDAGVTLTTHTRNDD